MSYHTVFNAEIKVHLWFLNLCAFTTFQQSQKFLKESTMNLSDLVSECLAVVVFLFFFLDLWSQNTQQRQTGRHHVHVCAHVHFLQPEKPAKG